MDDEHDKYENWKKERKKNSSTGLLLIIIGLFIGIGLYEAGIPFIGWIILIVFWGFGIGFILD